MQARPNLPDRPSPTFTNAPKPLAAPRAVALYTLAFSMTAGSTTTCSDFAKRLNLQPASITSSKNTNTTSLEQQVAVVASKPSWLETTIDELLAQVPEEEWAKVPARYVADIDKRM
jgi:hypothetical protein